jgi:hypothetical protein
MACISISIASRAFNSSCVVLETNASSVVVVMTLARDDADVGARAGECGARGRTRRLERGATRL